MILKLYFNYIYIDDKNFIYIYIDIVNTKFKFY